MALYGFARSDQGTAAVLSSITLEHGIEDEEDGYRFDFKSDVGVEFDLIGEQGELKLGLRALFCWWWVKSLALL